jgi:hypothetical protein
MPEDLPMTMWTPSGDVESDVSDLPGIDRPNKRRRPRSRRACRDGLADQTVVRDVEDIREYRAFERLLIRSIDPRTAIELALVHRLANLLWRLRRANAIETGLFEIHGEFPPVQRQGPSRGQPGAVQSPGRANGHHKIAGSNGPQEPPVNDREPQSTSMHLPFEPGSKSRTIAQRFLRLCNLDPALLDTVGRHEARLWRQAAQTIWTLDALRRPPPTSGRRSLRKPFMPFYWDSEKSRTG